MSKRRKNTFTRFLEDIIDDTKDLVDDLVDRAKDLEDDVRDAAKNVVDDDEDDDKTSKKEMEKLYSALETLTAKVNELSVSATGTGPAAASAAKKVA